MSGEVEKNEGAVVQTMFATEPVGLDWLPVFGREVSLFETMRLFFERWLARKGTPLSDRTQNPLTFFPASPGLGKTRMLNILTRVPEKPNDAAYSRFLQDGNNLGTQLKDAELKWMILEAIRLNNKQIRDEWLNASAEDFEHFCALFRTKTCGILISFNHRTSLRKEERTGKVFASEMIGIRIAFEAKLIEGCDYSEFGIFCQNLSANLGSQTPTLDWALNLVLDKVGEGVHIILGVDEMLLGAGVSTYEDYLGKDKDKSRLSDMLKVLGYQLDKRANIHIILTSLSYQYFKELEMTSGRSLNAIILPNLSFKESMALARFFNDERLDDERKWINDPHAKQIVQDCDGAPRLLEKVFPRLKPRKSLEALRQMCTDIEPINKLNAKRDRLMIVALVLALRGLAPYPAEEKCFDEAVYMGYLMSSSVIHRRVEPIFPFMTMWCSCERSELKREDAAFFLWKCIDSLLRLNSDQAGNHIAGPSFESCFRGLWRLRWMTRNYQIYNDKRRGATVRFPAASIISMKRCLSSFELEPDISSPPKNCTSIFEMRLKPPKTNDEVGEVSFGGKERPYIARVTSDQLYNSSVHQILTPAKSNEPGEDDIYTFPLESQFVTIDGKRQRVGQQTAVFVFQYKFSNPGAGTIISTDAIARAFVLSVTNNFPVFEKAINQNHFGFVFVSASHCNENVSANRVVMKIQELAKTEKDPKCREGIICASHNIAIMKRPHVLRFVPKSLRSRLQFRLEEQ